MSRKKNPTKPIDDLVSDGARAAAYEKAASESAARTKPEQFGKKWADGMARHFRARFASRLKAQREKAGLSLNALAQLAGVDHSQLVRLESGERTCTVETALQIAGALGVSLGILTDDKPKTGLVP